MLQSYLSVDLYIIIKIVLLQNQILELIIQIMDLKIKIQMILLFILLIKNYKRLKYLIKKDKIWKNY